MAENKSRKKGSKGCLSIFCLLPAAGSAFMFTAIGLPGGIQPQSIGGIIIITLIASGSYVVFWLAVYIPNYNLFEGIQNPTLPVTLRPEFIAKREHLSAEEQDSAAQAAAARQRFLNEGYYYNVIRKRHK